MAVFPKPAPIPVPEDQGEEIGSTQKTGEDIKSLQDQIAHLTEMVQSLTAGAKAPSVPSVPIPEPVQSPVAAEKPKEADMSTTRQVLESMAQDAGIEVTPEMTKEELISLLSPNALQQQSVGA